MKTIAILWNSMENNFSEALDDIRKYSTIYDYIRIDFSSRFSQFIRDIYPNNHKWKTDYKINILNNQYSKNEVIILFLEVPDSKKVYVERKKIYLYENVEKLKMFMRNKYMKKVINYCYDNIFHMTDDEGEYLQTLPVIRKHLIINFINNRKSFINLDRCLSTDCKKDRLLFADGMFMYKKINDNELYFTLFTDKIAEILGLDCAKNIPAIYDCSKGLLTFNFINNDELFIDGSHIIDFNITGNHNSDLILPEDKILKYNDIETISNFIKNYCFKNGLIYRRELINSLKKMYIFDMILLQNNRMPNNWGIIVNKKNHIPRFAPLHNNLMGIPENDHIFPIPESLHFEYDFDFMEDVDICILDKYLSRLDGIDIDQVFCEIERKNSITIPDYFKLAINEIFIKNIDSLKSRISVKQKVKRKI